MGVNNTPQKVRKATPEYIAYIDELLAKRFLE
jgi:hypothetical protein